MIILSPWTVTLPFTNAILVGKNNQALLHNLNRFSLFTVVYCTFSLLLLQPISNLAWLFLFSWHAQVKCCMHKFYAHFSSLAAEISSAHFLLQLCACVLCDKPSAVAVCMRQAAVLPVTVLQKNDFVTLYQLYCGCLRALLHHLPLFWIVSFCIPYLYYCGALFRVITVPVASQL